MKHLRNPRNPYEKSKPRKPGLPFLGPHRAREPRKQRRARRLELQSESPGTVPAPAATTGRTWAEPSGASAGLGATEGSPRIYSSSCFSTGTSIGFPILLLGFPRIYIRIYIRILS